MRSVGSVLLVLAFATSAAAVRADDFDVAVISADRPGIPFGTATVPTGHLQLETGLPTFQNTDAAGGSSTLLSTPTTLRYGLGDSFELQLGWSPYNRLTTRMNGREAAVGGSGDLQLGLKIAVAAGADDSPAITLLGTIGEPTGSNAFSAGRPTCTLGAVSGWNLGDGNSLSALLGYSRVPAADDSFSSSGALAVSVGHSFSDRTGAYLEAGYFPGFIRTPDTALAGTGITFLPTRHIQLDAYVDLGLNENSPNALFGTGMSILF